ncbi:MAG: flagellar hook-associated protein FlgL [Pseudomonadota bacterium]
MRVTDRHRYEMVGSRVEAAKAQNAKSLEQLSTQKKINRVSDDPIGVASAVRLKDRIATNGQFQKNVEFSKGMLERSETAVSAIQENLMRLKELAIGMANDTYDHSSRLAAAEEVREVIKDIVQQGNTTFNNRFVFSGFRSNMPTLSLDGKYMGDDGALMLQVGDNQFQQVNLQARQLFEADQDERAAGHTDLLDTAENLLAGLVSNSKDSIRFAVSELDFQLEKTSAFQAKVGSVVNSLNAASERSARTIELDKGSISNVFDADIFETSSEFRRSEAILQSTLLASTKLLQPSLLNFLQ